MNEPGGWSQVEYSVGKINCTFSHFKANKI